MLQITITHLKPGTHALTLRPEAEALGLDPERFTDIAVEVKLERGADRILVRFTASATATLECDRTLVLFQQPVQGAYTVLFASPETVPEGANDEDVRILNPTDQEIDLTNAVRDTLLLAVPTRSVAPGAEQIDIPTRFADTDDDPIDPRWEALKKLRDQAEP